MNPIQIPPACKTCNGTGTVLVTVGAKQVTRTCPACGGTKQAGPRTK